MQALVVAIVLALAVPAALAQFQPVYQPQQQFYYPQQQQQWYPQQQQPQWFQQVPPQQQFVQSVPQPPQPPPVPQPPPQAPQLPPKVESGVPETGFRLADVPPPPPQFTPLGGKVVRPGATRRLIERPLTRQVTGGATRTPTPTHSQQPAPAPQRRVEVVHRVPAPAPRPAATTARSVPPTTSAKKRPASASASSASKNPNTYFLDCCKVKKVHKSCESRCNFDVLTKKVLTGMFLGSDSCPQSNGLDLFSCAAQDGDHTPCCKRKNVMRTGAGEKCLNFCRMTPDSQFQADASYLPCWAVLNDIKACFRESIIERIELL